jgi:hypothetical protein
MFVKKIKRTLILCVVGIIATIGLTGCFKGEVSIDVKQNGTGTISLAIGMTQQAKALAASQSSNPSQDISKSLADGIGATPNVKSTTWIDGDYEWTKAEKEFANLDEINKALGGNKLFNNFSLTRSHSLLRDEFTLEAEFAPLNNNASGNNSGIQVDPSAFIQMSFSARLPGKIVETNGLTDINDPNRMVWAMASKQSVSIKARSTAWNWTSIVAISGFLFFIGVVIVGGVGFVVHARLQKGKALKKNQLVVNVPVPEMDFAALGVEKLLLQINEKVLDSKGQIQAQPGGITLIWKDAQDQERFINVKALAGNKVSINDRVYLATKKDIQAGIIDILRNQIKK